MLGGVWVCHTVSTICDHFWGRWKLIVLIRGAGLISGVDCTMELSNVDYRKCAHFRSGISCICITMGKAF